MRKIYLLICLLISATVASSQTSYTSTAVTTAWNTARWNNTADVAPYTSAFTATNNASFTSGAYSFAGQGSTVVVGNVTVAAGVSVNYTAAASTFSTGGNVRTFDIGAGGIFDFSTQAISTAAGTGFIKNGAGVFATAGATYPGGFTLNAGTAVARGTTAFGGGGTNTLTINGGTIAANASRSFANTRFPGGIVVAGDFQLGEVPANVSIVSNTANLQFDNNVTLGAATRTITLGNAATNTFTGVISNTSGGLTLAANANGTSGTLVLSGANTFTGALTVNGGTLAAGAINTIPSAVTMFLGGGTFKTGTAAGFSQTTGPLVLNASSTITLGTGIHSLNFLNSSAASWTGTLTITGWTGGYDGTASATAGRIFFGTDATGLTAGQLAQITFRDASNNPFPAVILSTGEVVPGPAVTIPDITLASNNPAVAAGNIAQGSTNNVIYSFSLAVTTANATLTSVTINTAGSYILNDFVNFRCWYSADNIFNPATDVLLSTITTPPAAGAQVFSPLSQTINNGSTGYIFITANVACSAVIGNTVSVNAITTADISFSSGNKTGTAFAGGLQTIIAATPNDVTTPAASVANASTSLTWTNPAGCYTDVLIVAATAPNTWVPTGTTYATSPAYGSGTALGNGFAVYQGTTSGQPVTGLTNGTPYYYKFFTRLGSTWSAGVEVTATPAAITVATDYFRSVASGDWATLATWQSSSDSTNWIAATLVPGATASHVTIQSPDSVYITGARTTINLTVMSGAKFDAGATTLILTNRLNVLGTGAFYQGGTTSVVPGVVRVLDPTSNYHFNGTQAGANGAFPEFGNLFWEPVASGNGTLQNTITTTVPFTNGLVIRGDMTINLRNAAPTEIRFATGASVLRSHLIAGNLNIISANSIAVIQNGTLAILSSVTVGGNINISAGILRGVASTGNGIINLSGNINNTGGTIQSGAGSGIFSINYVGTGAQSINNSGGTITFAANQADSINKPSGTLTLNTPITHAGSINFLSGIVNTSSVNLLTMAAGSSVLNASNASFVFGPVKKIGNTPFIFPVGKSNGYVPIGVSNFTAASAATDEFTAEYIRSSGAALGPVTDVFLNRVSGCEYWTLNLNNGTPTVDLTLYWNANNPCGGTYIANTADLEIAHFDGTNWNSSSTGFSALGGGSTNAAGNITWAGVTVFSPFTLASRSNANPLPIIINYLNGTKNNGNHFLNWKATCVSVPSVTIELQRSTDGRNYSAIYSVFATATRCQQPFDYTDNQPAKGINYYRLKITDADGKITYSSIVSLINAVKGIDVMNIAPNPIVNNAFNLKVSSASKASMQIVITDMQGRILQQQAVNLAAGFNSIPMNVAKLAAGTYQLVGNTEDGKTRVLRFVIQ